MEEENLCHVEHSDASSQLPSGHCSIVECCSANVTDNPESAKRDINPDRIIDCLYNKAFSFVNENSLRRFLSTITVKIDMKNEEIANLKNKCMEAEERLENVKRDSQRQIGDFEDKLRRALNELEDERSLRKSEAGLAEEKLRKHDEAAKRAISTYQQEVTAKLIEASKQVEDIRRERENAVMRFAQAEQQVIDSKVAAEKFEQQCKLAIKEKDLFQERIKTMTDEKKKLQAFIDQKTVEVAQLQKELRDSRESAREADSRLKLALAKSKTDQDQLQEIRLRFERAQQQLIETKTELERTKEDLNIKEQKHKTDKELGELQRQQENFQQRMELAEINERLRFELDQLKQKHRDCLEESITLKDRVACLNSELEKCNAELIFVNNEVASLKEDAAEAREESNMARERAAELVEHNQQLTLFRSQIQAETSGLRENLADLQRDFANMKEENDRLKTESASLIAQLTELRRSSEMTIDQLTAELNSSKTSAEDFNRRLQEQESMLISTRRKHAREVKELQRQLRNQQHPGDPPLLEVGAQNTRGLSRASSHNSDLDVQASIQHSQTQHSSSTYSLKNGHSQQLTSNNNNADMASQLNGDHQVAVIVGGSNEVSRQHIMDKIVSLQRMLAKKSERLDFLSEQVRCLTDEVQKKSRIIQVLATREGSETGAFSSDTMDRNKAAMAKRSGIMASVLSSEIHDGKMTLELSLEITRKLQEVLEETLLKNVMLKESLDTLGHEISHLSKENRDLKLTLKGVLGELPGASKK